MKKRKTKRLIKKIGFPLSVLKNLCHSFNHSVVTWSPAFSYALGRMLCFTPGSVSPLTYLNLNFFSIERYSIEVRVTFFFILKRINMALLGSTKMITT